MKTVISKRQGIGFAVLMMSETMVLGSAKEANSDLWIAIILALAIGLLMCVLYGWILLSYPGKNLYDILIMVLGRWIGGIIVILYIIYCLYVGSWVLINLIVFTNLVGLEATPPTIIGIMFIILVIVSLKKGIEVMGRWSAYFVRAILVMSVFMVIFMLPMIEVNNLKPVLSEGWIPVIEGTWSTVTFPFCELVIFMLILNTQMVRKKKSIYGILLGGLFISGILVLVSNVTAYVELGHYAYNTSYFPIYAAISRISIGDILQRTEILVALAFIMGGFMKVTLYVVASFEGIKKLMNIKDYIFLATPMGIVVLILALTSFDNIMEQVNDFKGYNYVAVLMQIIIPICIAIIIIIRMKVSKKQE